MWICFVCNSHYFSVILVKLVFATNGTSNSIQIRLSICEDLRFYPNRDDFSIIQIAIHTFTDNTLVSTR